MKRFSSWNRSWIVDKIESLPCGQWDRIWFLSLRYVSWKSRFHRRIARASPVLAKQLFLIIRASMRLSVRILRTRYPARYTDADPYKTMYVDPKRIQNTTEDIFSKRRGWVVDGTWDSGGDLFMERTYPKAIEQRFVERKEWNDTVLFETEDKKAATAHAESIDTLYDSIRQHGYYSQRELLSKDPSAAWNGLNDAMHPLANEISVDIGRDGELLWNICGQHRLAIAKVLDVDEVPVQVFRRHHEWQEIRDRARRGEEIPERFRAHPDLQDLFGKD